MFLLFLLFGNFYSDAIHFSMERNIQAVRTPTLPSLEIRPNQKIIYLVIKSQTGTYCSSPSFQIIQKMRWVTIVLISIKIFAALSICLPFDILKIFFCLAFHRQATVILRMKFWPTSQFIKILDSVFYEEEVRFLHLIKETWWKLSITLH